MIKDRFSEYIKPILSDDGWLILQENYCPDDNLMYESLFCLSNGYLGTRGAYEEGTRISLPCTYINGVFDKSETFMRELANLPDWLGLKLYVEKELIGVETCRVLEFSRVLDMNGAFLARTMVVEDKKGRKTRIEGLRFVSRNNVHRLGIRLLVTPLNYGGTLEVENIIDGSVINFADAPRFKVKHTRLVENTCLGIPCREREEAGLPGNPVCEGKSGAYLEVTTRDLELHVGIGSFVRVFDAEDGFSFAAGQDRGEDKGKNRAYGAFGETALEFLDFDARQGKTVAVDKYVAVYTEREADRSELYRLVKEEVERFAAEGINGELERHTQVYGKLWQMADLRIEGDFELNRAVRFNVFHLMSAASERDDRVNVGAKLLSGEEYGGHAFWDTELFMLPFFASVFPKTAKNLEIYRYRLLDAARENAAKNGYRGAQYPWESADDGTEQCPDWTIEPDGSCYRCYVAVYEHHVTAAVAYGIYNYVKITGDFYFLREKGAEILVETARFWASRCRYNEALDRYEIPKVTGPDEWHEPVDNNLYTNYLARWNLDYVLKLLSELEKDNPDACAHLTEALSLTGPELENWKYIKDRIYLPGSHENGLMEQFEGYFDLQDAVIEEYDKNDWPVRPEILKTMSKEKTRIAKQADVVMLLHLLGEEFDEETKRKNYSYYEKRCLHGSSLSPSIYSIMGLKVGDEKRAYRYLRRAAFIDLVNLQRNTREGIHAANAGGVWQVVVFGFAGVEARSDGTLNICPHMPGEWESLTFRIYHRGSLLEISVDGSNRVKAKVLEGGPVSVCINGVAGRIEGVKA